MEVAEPRTLFGHSAHVRAWGWIASLEGPTPFADQHKLLVGYHGHDAVVYVQPEQDAGGRAIIVRTLGGRDLPPGSPVTLRAHGPVLAWSRN